MTRVIKKIFSPRNLGAVIAILIVTGATALAAIPAYKSWLTQGANLYTTGTNVGIGTAAPSGRLHIADAFPQLYISSTGNGTQYLNFADNLSAVRWQLGSDNNFGTDGFFIYDNADSAYRFGINTAAAVSALILQPTNGNVGIGTTNPTQKLQVAGAIHSTTGGFMFPDGTVQTTAGGGGGGGIGGSGTAGLIPKFTGPATLGNSLISESGGTVFIGTAGTAGLAAGQILAFGGPGTPPPIGTITAIDGDIGLSYSATIGTANPSGASRAGISSEGFDQFGNVFDAGIVATCGTGTGGILGCYPGNSYNTLATFPVGSPDRGYIAVYNQSWPTALAGMFVDALGQGIVFGNVKNFREPNPNDPATDIWYASVEGPEAAAYIRGTSRLVNGQATIAFPDHFKAVAREAGMTVQLTPLSSDAKGLAVVQKSLDNGVVVRELFGGTGTYDFDWEVKAVRRGHEQYRVIRPRDEVAGAMPFVPGSEQQPEGRKN